MLRPVFPVLPALFMALSLAAPADAGRGNERRARAEPDAAEYLADMVCEASEH